MAHADPSGAPERYELLERIAVGGMAEVFRARATGAHGFEKTIAIKRILRRLAANAEFVKRFIAEAKLAVQLTHANIVQVLDFGRANDTLYIAMEYVDGPDLATLRKAYAEIGRPIPVAAAVHVAIELAKGLDFAHRRGVIHRDISPSNILLSMAGEVKIADFGIAKAVDSRSSLTMSRRIMGKWRYMSPEQTRGDALDARSDIFSVGVVMQELFTGRPLFGGRNIEDIVQNIREMPLPRPSSLRPDLPDGLDEVLGRALARDVEARCARASDLVRELTEVCFASKLVPTPNSLAEAIGQSFRDLAPTTTGEQEVRAGPRVDDLIEAELARAGAAGAGADEPTRITVELGPRAGPPGPGMAPVDLLGADPTHTTFIRGSADSDGLPVWERPTAKAAAAPPRAPIERGDEPAAGDVSASTPATGHAGAAPAARPRRGRWAALVVLLAAVLAAGALGGYALWGRGRGSHSQATTEPPATAPPGRAAAAAADAGSRVARASPADAGAMAPDAPTAPIPPRAHLLVRSEPAGATVEMDRDRVLGQTPWEGDVPADGEAHAIYFHKPGFEAKTARIRLTAGATVEVERMLARVRYGRIDIYAEPWADIYFRGRKLGETPKRGLRLPVGRQRLDLVNPVQHRKTTIWVEVPRDEPYQVDLP